MATQICGCTHSPSPDTESLGILLRREGRREFLHTKVTHGEGAAQGAGGVPSPGGVQGMGHSGLGDEEGIGHSWNSMTREGFSKLRDSGIPQNTKRNFDRWRGSGRRRGAKGLWKTRSTFTSPSHFPFLAFPVVLPLQHQSFLLFLLWDSSQTQQRKTLLQGAKQFFKTCKASWFSSSHMAEPTDFSLKRS